MHDVISQSDAHASASFFRHVLDCMSRPGRIYHMGRPKPAIGALHDSTFQILATLCDYQTPLWLCAELNTPEIRKAIRFATGAPLVDSITEAQFAVATARLAPDLLLQLAIGTHEYPDRAATLVHQVESLGNDSHASLSGPGIKDKTALSASGLCQGFWPFMQDNHTLFPLGIDVIFASAAAIAACPRSTAIVVKEQA